jgi:phosphoribosylaminoimidazole carboxylase (NCAIR synthetase)
VPTAAFVAPFLLDATLRFIDAAATLPDVRLALISQDPAEKLPASLRDRLAAHWRIDDGTDAQQIADATRGLAGRFGDIDRLVGMLEQLQVPLGEVRDALGIPGMGAEVARNFRDKSRMKDVFTAHGVPCAGHGVATSAQQASSIAGDLGLPVVVKPPAGAGARSTFRIDNADQLAAWLHVDPPSAAAPALLEELVTGAEHSFDSVAMGGRVVWHSISRYLPTPLEVLENPWIQWSVLLPRSIDGTEYDAIRDGASRGLRALGMDTGFSHMEWFRLREGRIALSEVAARPPGAQFTSLLSYAHDTDMYGAWARLEILGSFDPPRRRHAVGAVYLRGQGRGVVRGVHGLDILQHELGDLVVEARLPEEGQPRSESYEGEGYVILRHEDTEVVAAALRRVVEVARVELREA